MTNNQTDVTIAPQKRTGMSETLGYLKWFYTPFRTKSIVSVYDLVSTRTMSDRGLYLNLGYWKNSTTIDDACDAMARLLGERAGLSPDDRVLDVGFGFAEQDARWIELYGPRRIVGVNITASQVVHARGRMRERGLHDRVSLMVGSATSLPFASGSFDKVTALESAFHFDTRAAFFKEAWRVLRPGGRLVLADMARATPSGGAWNRYMQKSSWDNFSKKYVVPSDNADTIDDYGRKLTAAGFAGVRTESIWHDVYPGLHECLATDKSVLKRFHPLAALPYKLALMFPAKTAYGAFDYLIASADKPAS
jgi:cyclopropane fatty-acyl-phospholipid synthase-like methyltransferase